MENNELIFIHIQREKNSHFPICIHKTKTERDREKKHVTEFSIAKTISFK
jgi:hypothetical protein